MDRWAQSLVVRVEILVLGTQDPVYYEGEGERIDLNQKTTITLNYTVTTTHWKVQELCCFRAIINYT